MRRNEYIRRCADILSLGAPRRRRVPRLPVPRSVGVLLQWGIGDAVLAIPLLRAIRQAWPEARIDFLGKPWLPDLFAGEDFADGFVPLVPPWTKHRQKYRVWERDWRIYAGQLRKARLRRYDLLVGLRWDVREVAQLRLLRASETAGFANAGGARWITRDLGLTPEAYAVMHRSEAAAHAARALTGETVSPVPSLSVREKDRAAARATLRKAGYTGGLVVGIHLGAGVSFRRWPAEKFSAVLRACSDRIGCLVLIDDDTPDAAFAPPPNVPLLRWAGTLAGLKSMLSVCDVLLCNDSGPMHVAAAVGCRTVSIFGPGAYWWFGPAGDGHRAIHVDPMPCRPCFDACIYPSPICVDRIAAADVVEALEHSISARCEEDRMPLSDILNMNPKGR